jgi:uncharacterized protein
VTGQGASRRAGGLVAAVGLLLPTLVTWLYFVALADRSAALQQGAYLAGKIVQFSLPVVWVIAVRRGPDSGDARRPAAGVGLGLAFGLAVLAAMTLGYYAWLRSSDVMAAAGQAVREKLWAIGVTTLPAYAALAVFYSLLHALLEEYYWRWFAFGQLRRMMSSTRAIALSSLGFTAHHILLLTSFFGWNSPAAWLFALGVAAGGAFWAWLYHRSGSLLGPWLSHALIDAAVFIVGWDFFATAA